MSQRTEVEDFILKEFFAGKSVDCLVRDYMLTHEGSRKKAESIIYKVLMEYSLNY